MKSSRGITIFGCYGLFYLGILGIIRDVLKMPDKDLVDIAISVMYIILSYKLLQLKNWARISLIVINAIFAFVMLFANFFALLSPWERWLEVLEKEYPFFPLWGVVDFIAANVYYCGFIIFFTRRRIKEQFWSRQ